VSAGQCRCRERNETKGNVGSLRWSLASSPLNSDRLLVAETRARRTTLNLTPEGGRERGLHAGIDLGLLNSSKSTSETTTISKRPGADHLI
jgi:hypothetical protein